MTANDLIVSPPTPRIIDYPVLIAIGMAIVFTVILLIASSRFDVSGGVLTISLLVTLAFIGAVGFTLFFTVPNDEVTAAVLGGLTASFGAIIAYWLGRPRS